MTAAPPHGTYVYGPGPSRRLGRALGVDLVPFKTCTYDCIYCQLGPTTCKTVERKSWVDAADVVSQVQAGLAAEPDVIAISGSGEPTLHEGLGEVIEGIKSITTVPVAVVTNGSLLGLPAVQRDLAAADIVLPSLDVPDEDLFRQVNRPHPALRFEDVVEGMVAFRSGYNGRLWLEVLLLGRITAVESAVERLAAIAARIAPDRVQLNTACRPPVGSFAEPVSIRRLGYLAELFTPPAEAIPLTIPHAVDHVRAAVDLLPLLERRPCALEDIVEVLNVPRQDILKMLLALIAAGTVRRCIQDGRLYYAVTAAAHEAGEAST